MGSVLDKEHPDLVVYSGDQLTTNNINKNVVHYWKMVVDPCVRRGIPWAMVRSHAQGSGSPGPGARSPFAWFRYGNRSASPIL
jgi:hypothetical protein